ncbi:PKD domain-containing protein [Bacillus mycoides]|uniref:triple tyrosine motif-containing protein n=1 Tax=Bacillus mycoides TaxID=1405 RepID=UPI001C02AB1C|nr:triple tyrosine motif-containing protein [Bacillus mycoides]QWH13256.1 PKD domain-containing protein [Bacillus mycoides]
MKRNILSKIIILNLFFMCFFISVSSAKAEWDTKPPVLKSITFSKDVVKAGESIQMYVDAEDVDSGIDNITVALWNPSKNKRLDVYGFTKDEKGRWTSTVNIPEFSESGEWGYNFIIIRDRAGNETYINSDLDQYKLGTFKVEGQTNWDTKPPVLKNITYNKDVVRPGESIQMYVDAEDVDSGIDNITVALWNPSKNKRLDVYGFTKDEKGRWTSTVNIPEFSESGEWGYNFIIIRDRAGNETYINRDLDQYKLGTFKVEGQTNWDTKPPVLKNITYNKDVVRPGESIQMYVDAEDVDSGIDNITVALWNPSKNKRLDVYGFTKDEKGRWTSTVNIPEFSENGEWGYNFIIIRDRAGNETYINRDLDQYTLDTFKVDGQVSSVELNRDMETPKVGQTITFTAKATGSGQPVYQFWVREDGKWRIAQDYSKTNVFKYTPNKNGNYNVSVYAKDADAKTNQEAIKVNDFTVKTLEKVTAVELNRDIVAPKLDQTITFTAKATGSSQPIYQFWVREDGKWRVAQDYSKTNVFKYTPNKNGNYNVSVYAKDADAKTNQEAIKVNDFTVKVSEKVTAVELNRDIEAPKAGQPITFTAKATGSSQPVYQFWVREDGKWRIAQDYSKTNVFKYTPNKNGSYNVSVYAKDIDSKEKQESIISQGIIIK